MTCELQTHLTDGKLYRFIDPSWSPGKTMYIHSHPEYVDPEWDAFEIMVMDATQAEEPVWRTLVDREYESLCQHHWLEILDKVRFWASPPV